MVGTSGGKVSDINFNIGANLQFPDIRNHLKENIEKVYGLDTSLVLDNVKLV